MEMSKFKELMALAADMNGARTILELMDKGEIINLSNLRSSVQFYAGRFSPFYPRLKKLLEDFVADVEKEIEMLEVKTKEEK